MTIDHNKSLRQQRNSRQHLQALQRSASETGSWPLEVFRGATLYQSRSNVTGYNGDMRVLNMTTGLCRPILHLLISRNRLRVKSDSKT